VIEQDPELQALVVDSWRQQLSNFVAECSPIQTKSKNKCNGVLPVLSEKDRRYAAIEAVKLHGGITYSNRWL